MLYPGPVDYKIEVCEETSSNSSNYTLKSRIIVHGMYLNKCSFNIHKIFSLNITLKFKP